MLVDGMDLSTLESCLDFGCGNDYSSQDMTDHCLYK